ncbi:Retrovirus-related Pol polyprotein from transposon TNT 1-94 [Abeliophyllum distichum]|uniref:Retrovirus-related Pol polyprotein from transposon TNT 1-94 n=1 Tax=Abeliophyllum distichum TaxID=126358 RepID=A0ABD1TDM2_9LAMI
MNEAKSVTLPLSNHFKLSSVQSPNSEEELKIMEMIPYANAVGSIMYLMICTRPDIAHVVHRANETEADSLKHYWYGLIDSNVENVSYCCPFGPSSLQAQNVHFGSLI